MVHRKSTYKLSFKNINEKMRKLIWEENTVMREKRRTDEMSHHSIDEDDSECDCDSDEAIEENESINNPKFPSMKKQYEAKKIEDFKPKRTTLMEPSKDTIQRIEAENAVHKPSVTFSGEFSQSETEPHGEIDICDRLTLDEDAEKDDDLLESHNKTMPRTKLGRGYFSELNLHDLSGDSGAPKGNRGVMKFSPVTGEFDLIPSRLCKVKRTTPELSQEPQCRRISSGFTNTRNIINIRPRSSVMHVTSRIRQSPPREFHGFSDGGAVSSTTEMDRARRELFSTRTEPRLSASQKARERIGMSECGSCGQKIKFRGIIT